MKNLYGIEQISTKNLKSALSCYRKKIPQLLWGIHDIINLSVLDELTATQKTKLADRKILLSKELKTSLDLYPPLFNFDDLKSLRYKVRRLKYKRQAIINELEKRKTEGEPENVVETAYYIDFVSGSDANDGLSPANAWKTIHKYTQDTVRSAGDIGYVRRAQTHTYAQNIAFDEDGDKDNYITLMGDDGTGWSGEEGNSKPSISFGDAAYSIEFWNQDHLWHLKDLDVKESSDTLGSIISNTASGILLENLDVHDNGNRGMNIGNRAYIICKNCNFYSNTNYNVVINAYGIVRLEGSSLYGGAATTDFGVWCGSGGKAELIDTVFGSPSTHDVADINPFRYAHIIGRNVTCNSSTKVMSPSECGGYVKIEDYGGTKLNNKMWFYQGDITRDTAVVRSGGASSSALMEPNSNCGLYRPLELCMFTEELSRWLAAGSRTCTIYLRGNGWSTFPTNTELYIIVLYYDGATSTRASIKSTEVLAANDTWTVFDVSFTLNSASPCYVNVVLKKYESGAKVYVDILPVWS